MHAAARITAAVTILALLPGCAGAGTGPQAGKERMAAPVITAAPEPGGIGSPLPAQTQPESPSATSPSGPAGATAIAGPTDVDPVPFGDAWLLGPVLLAVGGALLLWLRRRGPTRRPMTPVAGSMSTWPPILETNPAVPDQPEQPGEGTVSSPSSYRAAGPFPATPAAPAVADTGDPLRAGLLLVARRRPSPGITEQIERLVAANATRQQMIDASIRFHDQLLTKDPTSVTALIDALRDGGVRVVGSDGLLFDPRFHEAVDTVSTADHAKHDLVAETLRPGFADGGRTVRAAEVIVYRYDAAETGTVSQ